MMGPAIILYLKQLRVNRDPPTIPTKSNSFQRQICTISSDNTAIGISLFTWNSWNAQNAGLAVREYDEEQDKHSISPLDRLVSRTEWKR